MSKRFLCACIIIAMIFAPVVLGLRAFAAVPKEVEEENIALSKDVEFRSFDDFESKEDMFDSWVDTGGIDGTGCQPLTSNHLTDGVAGWDNSSFLNAVAGVPDSRIGEQKNFGHMAWAYMDLGESRLISKIGVYAVDSWFLCKPVIQVSENGTDWDTVFSGAYKLLDSAGEAIYDGGFVNIEANMGLLADLTANELQTYAFTPAGVKDRGWTVHFDAVTARYVRLTGMTSSKVNGGTSNNTILSEIKIYAVKEGVLPPAASVPSGSYPALEEVALKTAYGEDAAIYYTVDGKYPTKDSALYEGPIALSEGENVIRAITVLNDGRESRAAKYIYSLGEYVENPALSKEAEFRSFDDFSVKEEMFDYWVDMSGIDGTGCRELTGNHMTDGVVGWDNSTFMNAVAGVTEAHINDNKNLGHMVWVYLDLGKSFEIDGAGIYGVNSWFFCKPVIQVSENGTDWNTVFSGAKKLLNSEGAEIYSEGYVNTERNSGILYDYTGNAVESYALNRINEKGWEIAFDSISARYIRITGMYSSHLDGGTSNNTAISEITVHGTKKSVLPAMEAAVITINLPSGLDRVRYGTEKEELLTLLAAKAVVTDSENQTHEIELAWDLDAYDGAASGNKHIIADFVLPENVANVYGVTIEEEFEVAEKAVMTELLAAIEDGEGYDKTQYTEETYAVLENALNAAREVAANERAYQEEADAAKEAVASAVEGLKFSGDFTALREKVDAAKALEAGKYTASSFATLQAEIERAEEFMAADRPQSEIDGFEASFDEVTGGLVLRADKAAFLAETEEYRAKDYTKYTDKTRAALESSIANAADYIEETAEEELAKDRADAFIAEMAGRFAALEEIGNKEELSALIAAAKELSAEDYTGASYAALCDAVTAAEAVAESTDVNQVETDAAKEELSGVRDALVSVKALKEAAAAAEAKEEAAYLPAGWLNFAAARDAAKAVLRDAEATREEIETAAIDLENAANALKEKPDKTELNGLIGDCRNLKKDDYKEGYEALESALSDAEAVLADENADKETVALAADTLKAAKAGLVEKEKEEESGGCGSSAGGGTALSLLALAAIALLKKKTR